MAEQHSPILLMAARWGDQAPGFPPPRFLSSSIFQKKKAWAWVKWSACEMPVYEAAAGTKKLKEQARVFALHANALWCQHGVKPAVAPPRFGTPGTPSLRRGAFSCRLFSTTHSQVTWRRHLCHSQLWVVVVLHMRLAWHDLRGIVLPLVAARLVWHDLRRNNV